jgi:hypothetical protein
MESLLYAMSADTETVESETIVHIAGFQVHIAVVMRITVSGV